MPTPRLIFISSLLLLLCTPFLYADVLYYPYVTTRVILLAFAVIGIIISTAVATHRDSEFRAQLVAAVGNPVISIYGIIILWLFVRTLPVATPELWWGSLDRTDGIVFHLAWLLACIACAAWFHYRDGFITMKKITTNWVYFVVAITLLFGAAEALQWYTSQFSRLSGSVGNPLYLSGLLLFIPWAAQFIGNKYVRWGSIVFVAAALYAADTRGAFIAVAAMIVVYMIGTERIAVKLRIALTAVFLIATIGFIIGVAQDRIPLTRMSTIQTRVASWRSGWGQLKENPLIGFGSGKHVDAIDRGSVALKTVAYSEISNTTHSAYLDLALRGGAIAVLLFILWTVVVLYALWKKTPQLTREQRLLAGATYVGYLVFIATSFISIWHLIPLLLMIGLVRSDSVVKTADRAIVRSVTVVGGLVVVSMVILIVTMMYAGLYLKYSNAALAQRQWQEIPKTVLRLMRGTPFASDLYIEQLRLSLPNTQRAVVPSYENYVQQRVVPTIYRLLAWNDLHPQQYYVIASWITAYTDSGLTADREQWLRIAATTQERALQISPDRPQSIFQLADVYRELGNTDRSLEILRGFTERHSNFPEGYLFYGMMLDIADKKTEATEQARQAVQLRPLGNKWGSKWGSDHWEWLKERTTTSTPR